jgi:inosine-uridine nucleoside N-ribohydrolase
MPPIKLIFDADPGVGTLFAPTASRPQPRLVVAAAAQPVPPQLLSTFLALPAPLPDDSMAILAAFNSPEIEILGLTTMDGNVPTPIGALT